MTYLPRHADALLGRLARLFPVVLVGGARQTGKSTLLAQHPKIEQTFVFDPAQDVAGARQDPELFLSLHRPPLVLDEVQHAPELLGALKRVVDRDRGGAGRYFLTGSQQFGVLGSIRETLAGRVGLMDLPPMARRELEAQPLQGFLDTLFSADPTNADDLLTRLSTLRARSDAPKRGLLERLFRGGYPGLLPFATEDCALWFDSYFRTYIERDVHMIRRFDDPHDFARFVRLIGTTTAQELNASHLGREIGIANRTARAWLDALVQSYQAFVLDAWSGNTLKRVSGRPKVHLWDTGLASWLMAVSTPTALGGHPALGALFETWVVTELHKEAMALSTRPRLWHWRVAGGAEVDLILERDGVFHPIEVKLASQVNGRHTRGLRSFEESHPSLRVGTWIVIYGGRDLRRVGERALAVPADLL